MIHHDITRLHIIVLRHNEPILHSAGTIYTLLCQLVPIMSLSQCLSHGLIKHHRVFATLEFGDTLISRSFQQKTEEPIKPCPRYYPHLLETTYQHSAYHISTIFSKSLIVQHNMYGVLFPSSSTETLTVYTQCSVYFLETSILPQTKQTQFSYLHHLQCSHTSYFSTTNDFSHG